MFEAIKDLLKDNWKWLARKGWEHISKHLLPRLQTKNPFLGRVVTQTSVIGDKAAHIITDDNPKDVEQLRVMLCQEYPDLLEVVLAGAADYLPNETAKRQAIAMLGDTAERIAATLPQTT